VSAPHLLKLHRLSLTAFGSALTKHFENGCDTSLFSDIQTQIRGLPLLPSSTLAAKQDETLTDGKSKNSATNKDLSICLLRTFAFLLLDSSAAQAKGRLRKSCIRLMKVALKAARVCIENSEFSNATKILERAAEYQDILGKEANGPDGDEGEAAHRLRMEYFAVRTTLVGGPVSIRTQRVGNVTNFSHPGMASRARGHSRAHVRQVQATHRRSHS
jgi:hypothetical protein